jgi:integrase
MEGLQMASIATSKNGHKRILYYGFDKRRVTIHIGIVDHDFAVEVKNRVERLQTARITGTMVKADAFWIEENPTYRKKFEIAGLIERRDDEPDEIPQRERMTLESFLTLFMDREGPSKKPATRIVWNQVFGMLKRSMPGVMLDEVTVGHCKKFRADLQEWKLSPATIHKRIQFAKQFFQYAVDWKLIDANPFAAVKVRKPKKTSNVEVPLAKIETVLEYLAEQEDPVWAAIIGLSRFGGLRCPSETLSIQWGDIDFDKKRMHIPEPKVEHHSGRGRRECRLFEDLEPILVELFNHTHKKLGRPPSRDEYVIDKPDYRAAADRETGWANANLRTHLLRILERAKVEPWPRLFHSMRASCQTELEEQFPLHVVCRWLGNSESIAKENYLLTKDSHYEQPMKPRRETKMARAVVQNERRNEHAGTTQESDSPKENIDETAVFTAIAHSDQWRIGDLNGNQVRQGKQRGNANDSDSKPRRDTNLSRAGHAADSLPPPESNLGALEPDLVEALELLPHMDPNKRAATVGLFVSMVRQSFKKPPRNDPNDGAAQ